MRRPLLLILASFFILIIPFLAHAETKILTAEATYLMGDGETPSFAEAMVLQKAKQIQTFGLFIRHSRMADLVFVGHAWHCGILLTTKTG